MWETIQNIYIAQKVFCGSNFQTAAKLHAGISNTEKESATEWNLQIKIQTCDTWEFWADF